MFTFIARLTEEDDRKATDAATRLEASRAPEVGLTKRFSVANFETASAMPGTESSNPGVKTEDYLPAFQKAALTATQ